MLKENITDWICRGRPKELENLRKWSECWAPRTRDCKCIICRALFCCKWCYDHFAFVDLVLPSAKQKNQNARTRKEFAMCTCRLGCFAAFSIFTSLFQWYNEGKSTRQHCFLSIILRWGLLIELLSTLISSISRYGTKLRLWKAWWTVFWPNVRLLSYTVTACENTLYQNKTVRIPLLHFLVAVGIPCILDSVIAELEKLGPKYRLALK